MSPRPDVSAERKDQILAAAEEVFGEKHIRSGLKILRDGIIA